jgi:hypothetical protein
VGTRRLRIDIVEKLSRAFHAQRMAMLSARAEAPEGQEQRQRPSQVTFPAAMDMAISLGLAPEERDFLLHQLGFRCIDASLPAEEQLWRWRGMHADSPIDRPKRRSRAPQSDGAKPGKPSGAQQRKRRDANRAAAGSEDGSAPATARQQQQRDSRPRQPAGESPFAALAGMFNPPAPPAAE